ncbi:MAG: family 78 glycoside hydrolase catalytic domain [Clostridia bacterium]|nr:family 78 glycoside hydrolase catalytic domain [Clostridia bacterium]
MVNKEFSGTICAWMGSPITVRADRNRDPQSVTVYQGATGANGNQYGKINVLKTYGDESFTLNPGETALIDFGQNFAGWEAFTVEGNRGTVLTIEHGEILNDNNGLKSRGNDGPEGSIYNANYRSAAATTVYTLAGGGKESYHPAFSFYGFRYIEITTTETVTIHSVDGQVVTSVERDDGFIETSDKDVNQLISNIRWGQYSNYLSIPTDCPQRDERMGWTADTQVFAEAGMYMAFSKSFLEKFLTDLRDSQRADGAYPGTTPTGNYGGADWGGTGWADAGIIVPYNLYVHYGDTAVIEDNWKAMKKYVDSYLGATGGRGPRNVWGDWLAYESNDGEIQDMLAVAFYAWDALMMAEMATAIGKDTDAKKYLELYETEKEYFIDKYVKENGQLKRGEQSVCLYALFLNLVPNEESFEAIEKQLVDNIKRKGNRLQTGFLGTAIILPTLTKIGRSDLAYTLLLQHDNPSWLYSVDQGATTIWERWNSYTIENGFGDVGMNSFNHYAYGAVAAWMFDSMAGINTSTDVNGVGFKKIVLAPQPDSRLAVKASYESAYGTIKAESTYENSVWTYNCSLPANTTGEIRIPAAGADYCIVNGKAPADLTLEADGLAFKGVENGVLVFEAVSGSFSFVTRIG